MKETLEVKIDLKKSRRPDRKSGVGTPTGTSGKNIHDILKMTVEEAEDFFPGYSAGL